MSDKMFEYIRSRVRTALVGKMSEEKFNKMYDQDTEPIRAFFDNEEIKVLIFYTSFGDRLEVSHTFPKEYRKKAFYFLKRPNVEQYALSRVSDLQKALVSGELSESALENLHMVAQEVYFPLLANPNNRDGWSGPTSKQVMLDMSSFLARLIMTVGKSKGQTLLPKPPPEAFDEDNVNEQDRMRLLENAVITWSTKIRDVLKTDPGDRITAGEFPMPRDELEFWQAKAADLTHLQQQLQQPELHKAVELLVEKKNPFGTEFAKGLDSVLSTRDEAKENARYFQTLRPYVQQLEKEASDFAELDKIFPPLMHTLMLIWEFSSTYNTNHRLSVVMQEICNALIRQAQASCNGQEIFGFIQDENVMEAAYLLRTTIKVCSALKNQFRRYRYKIRKKISDTEWAVSEDSIFVRLNAFLERCEDILEFTRIVVEFSKLEKIRLGGTKGAQFSKAMQGVHRDFVAAVEKFRSVPYDIMDIEVKQFDDDFYHYRCEVKDLERRLAALIGSAFDDAATLDARFKLLQSVEGLLERPIIKDEMDRKQPALLKMYSEDLVDVQNIFNKYKDMPRVDNNFPPTAGALSWCRGLTDRVTVPMERLGQYTRRCDRQEVKEVQRMYEFILQQLRNYENSKVEAWTKEIDESSERKLQQPLLRREPESRLLYVNFDDALVRLLREVKYFLVLDIKVAPTALTIFSKAETYRQQRTQLQTITTMYNEMIETLHSVEKPLVDKDIHNIDQFIEKGISSLNWKSTEVDSFVQEAFETVRVVYKTVKVMKDNLESIRKMMADFAAKPLMDRKNKPLPPADVEDNLRKLWDVRHKQVRENQATIKVLLDETSNALNISQGEPVWRAYQEYVQDVIKDGLAAAIINSIHYLSDQLDPIKIEKNEIPPLLEIKLGLYANDVLFNAEDSSSLGSSSHEEKTITRKSRRDVWQVINDWMEYFFEIGNIMSRSDNTHYVGDLKKNEGIVRSINQLKKHLDWNQKECEQYRSEYTDFDMLWKADRNAEFRKFLTHALAQQRQEAKAEAVVEVKEHKKRPTASHNTMDAGAEGLDDLSDDEEGEAVSEEAEDVDTLPLEAFERKILYYKEIQTKIAEKKTPVQIGWLKVNAIPIKNALNSWVNRWIHLYTSYMYNYVTAKLHAVDDLMNTVEAGLNTKVPHGDSEALKKVLGHIHQVRSREKDVSRMFQPLRNTVAMLKKYGITLEEEDSKLLAEAPTKWEQLVTFVYTMKGQVNQAQNEEVDKIKQKVKDFDQSLQDFRQEYREDAPFEYDFTVAQAYDGIYDFHQRINELEKEALKLRDLENVFELPRSRHRAIKKTRQENRRLKQVWDMISVVRHQFNFWKKTPWNDIDTDQLLTETRKLRRNIDGMASECKSWKVYIGLRQEVDNLLTVLPLVNLLHSPSMEERHWEELEKETGQSINKDAGFCLSNLLDLQLHKYVDGVKDIVQRAGKESKIQVDLQKMEEKWAVFELDFADHPSGTGVIKMPDEVLQTLEEHMSLLQGMSGQGKFVEHFLAQVQLWQDRLSLVEAVLSDWLDVQKKWASLQAIFLGSEDIKAQLPEDCHRFVEIDQHWKTLMSSASDTPNVIEACSAPGRQELLETLKVGLEQCEKALFQYLEAKRKAFPRFYFLSNSALLHILSNGDNPTKVQEHLGDCFDNIHHLSLRQEEQKSEDGGTVMVDTHNAIGMHSKDGEEFVPFATDFVCEGAVEDWLNRLVAMMRLTLRDILGKAKFTADQWEIEKPRREWLFGYPAQIALTASQIIWTEEVNSQFDAFADGNEHAMKEYSKTLELRLQELIGLILHRKLSKEERTKTITLITVDVHNRDVVQQLIEDKVMEPLAFAWQRQMRYEWLPDTQACNVKIADATFRYSYEYVGNTGRLVITPLTDRCYITLTQALRLVMGGAPAGPAGTGKTETTKDLGRALGLPVYVFNCSEQMNVHSLGSIFKGLSQTGGWGCFDEFNRIPIEVLSVVSTQVSIILNALRERREEFDFMGEICRLVDTVGIFVTMNPGYAGRTELPENLKALFRSCAMVVPDYALICENMLLSEGFRDALRLSKKFVTLYSLSKELLSKQKHYDWGLRAFKAVLRVAGSLKRAEGDNTDVENFEDRVLMRALRDFNIPKLVEDDKAIFLGLISDLFPLVKAERKVDRALVKAVEEAAKERLLQPEERFVLKCIELNEILDIRHSVFIIGPAGTGKSEVWRTLNRAYNRMGDESVYAVMNPKAITTDELYGFLAKTDWQDGVLSKIMRDMFRNNPPYKATQAKKWICLDGDIDPNWIESLNTVMDDNKVLTLVSNERIQLTDEMRMVFEIASLEYATPATVSRAGILYINPADVGPRPYLDSWIDSRTDDKEKSSLRSRFNSYLTSDFMTEIKQKFSPVIPIDEMNAIRTLCTLLEGLLERMKMAQRKGWSGDHLGGAEEEEKQAGVATGGGAGGGGGESDRNVLEAHFVFATIWAFGGCLVDEKGQFTRKRFSEWWKSNFGSVKFPNDGTVFDYFVHPLTGKMIPWTEAVPQYTPGHDAYLVPQLFVPTSDTTRLSFLMKTLVPAMNPVMLVGSAGTGKTSVVKQFLRGSLCAPQGRPPQPSNFKFATINLSYYTDSAALQRILEGYIDKRSGRIYGPTGNRKLIYFLDDLNMPYVDEYGTQSPHALIRQHMDYGTWYETQGAKLEKKEIRDVSYVACMNPTAGSFTINPRLQGHFMTFACMLPSKEALSKIYGTIVDFHLANFPPLVAELAPSLVKATIDLHDVVQNKFLPSSAKFHYIFTLRDLSNIFQGVCLSQVNVGYDPGMMVRLWQHECTRVFGDRLVSKADMDNFEDILYSMSKKFFRKYMRTSTMTSQDIKTQEGEVSALIDPNARDEVPLIFTSFMAGHNSSYLPVPNMTVLKRTLVEKLNDYNANNPQMNLELFEMAVKHVCRITRIIENPRGNALLVGVGGSGKQSLARLAAHICGYDIFQISVTQSYGMAELRTDLQDLYRRAGVKSVEIMFLLTDAQVVHDEWLVYINDLLSSGYIPDLFSQDDKDSIINSVRNEARAQGYEDTPDAIHDFFISNVRQNLHVVLCFSPVGAQFRVWCRKFPAVISSTSIDWFHPWPRDALTSVARRFLSEIQGFNPDVTNALAEHMAAVHLSVGDASKEYRAVERRYNYTTPKSFLELIAFYKSLLAEKRQELIDQINRLAKGINILKRTQSDVAKLRDDLTNTLVEVTDRRESASELIAKTAVERKKVEQQQLIAAEENQKAKMASEVANQISQECQKELDARLPILMAAEKAAESINRDAINTLRAFTNPPGNVVYVTNAILILRQIPGRRDWAAARRMMARSGAFLEELQAFRHQATDIDESVIRKLTPILEKSFFNPQEMRKSSEAAASLCEWVINIVNYSREYKSVAPRIAARDKAVAERDEAQRKLAESEKRVVDMQRRLQDVTAELEAAQDSKMQVERQAEELQDRLALARRLVDGLMDENDRWTRTIGECRQRGITLVGDVMLAAAFVSYIGAFNTRFRYKLWKEVWTPDIIEHKIPLTEGVDPLLVVANDSMFATWKNNGLAADRMSLENGAIINSCIRWPLMIDPQLQGSKWTKQRYDENELKVVQLNQKGWLQIIIRAIQDGHAVLLENVGEELVATLDPLLARSVIQSGSQQIMRLGGEEVVYNPDFRLLIQTKLSNPHYKPEIAAQCTLINFIVTEGGLEEQLLALVVNQEKPELEEKRSFLVRSINNFMVSLTELENELLERLSNAPDDILSDSKLIEGLENTKRQSVEIDAKVQQAKKQEVHINAARDEFRMVAAESSWLYFLLTSLNAIDHMYQYSLNAFIRFFTKAMNKAEQSDSVVERVVNLRRSIRLVIFTWVNRGLFEHHKLIFASQLTFKLMQKGALVNRKFHRGQFEFLIRGPQIINDERRMDWVAPSAWHSLLALVKVDGFETFISDMEPYPHRFKEWYNKPRPESVPLPMDWRKLDVDDPFRKLCVVKAMRPDRMTTALVNFVRTSLPEGKSYTECDASLSFLDVLTLSWRDSSPVTPIFFILSSGADPVSSVELLAKKHHMYDGKFYRLALGEGQDVNAMNLLDISHREGHWVVLENIHLMPRWLPALEKKLDDFATEGSHKDFRVFLSAEPSKDIPIGILERSLKLTNEPPQGLKQNLKRAFATFDKDEFEFKDPKVKAILFGLCHFHSIIIERIKFGAKGWNRAYPFSTGDLLNSSTVLANYLESGSDKIPFKDLRYIFGQILYGGHITDDWDRLLCKTYLQYYMKEDLLDEMELYPFSEAYESESFLAPPVLAYDQYFEYIDNEMTNESPIAFGMHPNAEIAVKTAESEALFKAVMELQPRSASGDGESTVSAVDVVQNTLTQIMGKVEGSHIPMDELKMLIGDDLGPYQNVFLQECFRMNFLTGEVLRSLGELQLGLAGELQVSERMEVLQEDLYLNRVPETWARNAYPSQRSLSNWVDNLMRRQDQLAMWADNPAGIPAVTNISYMFNPQSFLTAIMQRTAQRNTLELDKLTIQTDVTTKKVEDTIKPAREGAFVCGLNLEGAKWQPSGGGSLVESTLREMYYPLPVVLCRANPADKNDRGNYYKCPVYRTTIRGPTYVFTANLKTKVPPSKWILAGVAIVMEVV